MGRKNRERESCSTNILCLDNTEDENCTLMMSGGLKGCSTVLYCVLDGLGVLSCTQDFTSLVPLGVLTLKVERFHLNERLV